MFEIHLPSFIIPQIARFYSSRKRMRRAKKAFDKGLESFHALNLKKSLQYYNLAIMLDEFNNVNYYLERAYLKTCLKKDKEAFEDLEYAKSITGNSVECQLSESEMYINIGLPKKAIAILSKTIQDYPSDSDAFNAIGYAHILLEEYSIAFNYLEKAIELDPFNNYAWENKGFVLLKRDNNIAEAYKCIEKSKSINPNNPYVYKNEALILRAEGKLGRAVDSLFKAADLGFRALYGDEVERLIEDIQMELMNQAGPPSSPDSSDTRQSQRTENTFGSNNYTRYKSEVWAATQINMAYELGNNHQNEEAVRLLLEVLDVYPELPVVLNNIGFEYIVIGNTEEAIPYLEKCIEHAPDFAFAWNNLGYACFQLGAVEKAKACLKTSEEIQPDNSYLYRNKGLILHYEKKYSEALAAFLKAKKLGYNNDYGDDIDPYIKDLYKILSDTKRSD